MQQGWASADCFLILLYYNATNKLGKLILDRDNTTTYQGHDLIVTS